MTSTNDFACLLDFVGISPALCCGCPPLSGLYLSQLWGIELSEIDSIASKDQQTFNGLWNDLQITALDSFKQDVIEQFSQKYQLRQITQSVDLGKIWDNKVITDNTGDYQYGMQIDTVNDGTAQCAQSNLMKIFVQSVNFYYDGQLASPPTFTVNFVDADQKTIIQSLVVENVKTGWNSVWVNLGFDVYRLYITVTGNFDSYVNLDISNFNLQSFGNYGFGYGWQYGNGSLGLYYGGYGCGYRLQGVQIDNNYNVIANGTNCFGLSAVVSAKCSYDTVVCQNMQQFAFAWQQKLGIEFMNYLIYSTRLNQWTTIKKERAIKLLQAYELKYRGGRDTETGLAYPGTLPTAINSVYLDDMDCCLKCSGDIMFKESHP